MIGLYIHIPFCASKCAYCDFCSEPPKDEAQIDRTLSALRKELESLPEDFNPDTLYIGGGSPSLLSPEHWRALLPGCARFKPEEWTVEMNPGQVDVESVRRLIAAGVNRFSLGAQTLRDDILQTLGRRHSSRDIFAAIDVLRGEGAGNLSIDLMYGLPGLTAAHLQADVERLAALKPEHFSIYALSLEADTPLARSVAQGRYRLPDDDETADQYALLCRLLETGGWDQYELSNFAHNGQACQHNRIYWEGGEYRGIGPSAHSYTGGIRSANEDDPVAWRRAIEASASPTAFCETLTPERRARERLLLWLRKTEGVPLEAFKEQTGFDADTLLDHCLDEWKEHELVKRTDTRLRLRRSAYFISDAIFREIV